jgi:uncharacterized protein
VKVVDANVLLYAVDERADRHQTARKWLDSALTGEEAIAFAWVVVLAFLRLSTNPHVFPRPLRVEQALDVVDAWLSAGNAVVVEPTSRHLGVLGGLLRDTGSAANLVNDAHLAALAAEHGATVVSYDANFARFPGVRWSPPTVDT